MSLLAAACTAPHQGTMPASTDATTAAPPQEVTVAPAPAEDWEVEFARQRMIGDLLYDALRALEQDRLLTPVDDNAHQRYQRVLAFDPANALALEGLRNIVARYLELAAEAGRQGRFDDAMEFIERARFVDQEDPAITEAWLVLQADMRSGDQVYRLNPRELAARSSVIQDELAQIARRARQDNAFFLITAPNDEQARWIFSVMREAVDGFRLRGNIEIGNYAIVRLRRTPGENS